MHHRLLLHGELSKSVIALTTPVHRINFEFAITVEPQCLEPLWDNGNLFETWVVRATEG